VVVGAGTLVVLALVVSVVLWEGVLEVLVLVVGTGLVEGFVMKGSMSSEGIQLVLVLVLVLELMVRSGTLPVKELGVCPSAVLIRA